MLNSNHQKLAPVCISTYVRLEHLRQTMAALELNTLASQSEIYVFSDAAKPGDEANVQAVRDFLKTLSGFKSVTVFEREKNNRVFNNREGMMRVLQRYGRLILLEEDVITAPGFLSYMNEALDFYRDAPHILSICGYCPPLNQHARTQSFVLPRFCAWGMGITLENYRKIQPIPLDALDHIDRKHMARFGDDIFEMVCKDARGELDALDVRAMYHQYLTGALTLYPQHSLVRNIGFDGTGLHCGKTNHFDHKTLWKKTEDFEFSTNPSLDPRMVAANMKFRRQRMRTLKKCIGRILKSSAPFGLLDKLIKR